MPAIDRSLSDCRYSQLIPPILDAGLPVLLYQVSLSIGLLQIWTYNGHSRSSVREYKCSLVINTVL